MVRTLRRRTLKPAGDLMDIHGMAAFEGTDLRALGEVVSIKRAYVCMATLKSFRMGQQQLMITDALVQQHGPKRAAVMLLAMAKDAEARA